MTYSMTRFAAYDWAKTRGSGPAPGAKMALAGSMAGGIAGIIGTPFESIMVRCVWHWMMDTADDIS